MGEIAENRFTNRSGEVFKEMKKILKYRPDKKEGAIINRVYKDGRIV